uniref:RND family efflux transporter, MFP subunit n=1 Tax=Candidatus Kentrum eta TaxID=2126337 RepID=A0A450V7W3_9GAMM|nr:MAG: RND family efflux transporter, MFP subunit [Candidatus Kentron sp. H]VFJ94173.1 MAG: RND family efflux transporter, MFP subunit [Candidatus Kentron sp. H]VFK00860.1 MAG: RND family efflux transporter, MFP subunit [Candidatus Kentron sp. H]
MSFCGARGGVGSRSVRPWKYHAVPVFLIAAILAVPARAEPRPSHVVPAMAVSSPATTEIHAQLRAPRQTVLSSELSTKVQRIFVREGERFTDKRELVRFDCALEQARLAKMKVMLAGARKNAKIQQRLLELNSMGTLEVELARVEVDKARADVRTQLVVLSKCTLRAPFSGRVVEVKASEHQFVQTGEPLLEILDDSSIEIDFIVPSHWLAWLEVGLKFSVTINETGRGYPGEVLRLGARVDPVSQLVKVMGGISGRFPELMSGMSGRVTITPP